jgi:hypothetical protein
MSERYEKPEAHTGPRRPREAAAAMMASLSEKERRAIAEKIKSRFADPELRRRLEGGWRAFEDAAARSLRPPSFPVLEEIGADLCQGALDDRAALRKKKGPLVLFPTPPDSTWEDVHVRFKDGHTVSIRVKSETGMFNYTQMGMASRKNGNPTVQWELLRTFADEGGTLVWSSSKADRRNQKRREILAANLRCFFQIDTDPFRLTPDRKGWEANFHIFPDK